jgi:hypothetical protein
MPKLFETDFYDEACRLELERLNVSYPGLNDEGETDERWPALSAPSKTCGNSPASRLSQPVLHGRDFHTWLDEVKQKRDFAKRLNAKPS